MAALISVLGGIGNLIAGNALALVGFGGQGPIAGELTYPQIYGMLG